VTIKRRKDEGRGHRAEERRQKSIFCMAVIMIASILSGCSESPKKSVVTEDGSGVIVSQYADSDTACVIKPVYATAQTAFTLRAANSVLNKGEIQWYVNDIRRDSVTGVRFSSSALCKGDVVRVSIIKDDKECRSNEIVVQNTPPVISEARLLPQTPKSGSRLTVSIKGADADRDVISFRYKWSINDAFAGEENYLETELKKGDIITVEVTPFDDEGPGKGVRLRNSVYNSLPVITESVPSFDGKTYVYQITAADPDGDSLTYALKDGPQGMTVDPEKGVITWQVPPGDTESRDVVVSVSDNRGGELILPINVKIILSET